MRLVDRDDHNVRGSSKTARAVFQVMVSLSAQRAQPGRKRFLSSCVSVSPASRYGAFRVAGHASDRSVGGTQAHLQPEPASASAAPVPAHNPQADLDSDWDADCCKVGRLERPQVSVYYIS